MSVSRRLDRGLCIPGLRIEVAAARIFQHAVFHTIQRIAGFEHSFVDELIFARAGCSRRFDS